MKRVEQLQPLSRDHHQSLLLAQQALKISSADNAQDIAHLCQQIVVDYPHTWKIHFAIEEQSIFAVLINQTVHFEAAQLCRQLEKEHRLMDAYCEQMKAGDYSCLHDFGHLLKQHTRMEERQLFPILETIFNTHELDSIYKLSVSEGHL